MTNWFQNQRTQARKHKEDLPPLTSPSSTTVDRLSSAPSHPSSVIDDDTGPPLTHLNFPPRAPHPSLVPDRHLPLPSLPFLKLSPPEVDELKVPRSRMSLPPSSNPRLTSPRMRRSVTPYSRDQEDVHRSNEGSKADDIHPRPRRSRPEPYQLEALKKLLHRTSTPSIEQRNALALEVGMYVKLHLPSHHLLKPPSGTSVRSRTGSATSAKLPARGPSGLVFLFLAHPEVVDISITFRAKLPQARHHKRMMKMVQWIWTTRTQWNSISTSAAKRTSKKQ